MTFTTISVNNHKTDVRIQVQKYRNTEIILFINLLFIYLLLLVKMIKFLIVKPAAAPSDTSLLGPAAVRRMHKQHPIIHECD